VAGRPTSAELGRRKVTIMEVATQLFIAQGYSETSFLDIARRAGVATRTLYQHFGDKEAIFREVIYARREAAEMPSPTLVAEASLVETLRREAHRLVSYVLAERSVDLTRLMISESARFPELMRKVANATLARVLANITHILRDLAKRGEIPDGDHETSAGLFADLIVGTMPLMVYTHWQTGGPSPEEIARKVDLFIRGRFNADPAMSPPGDVA
jgi:TetR/AcrR family transcriptional repressor of mexJK operon